MRKLKTNGFEFDRQAASSHEIWSGSASGTIHSQVAPGGPVLRVGGEVEAAERAVVEGASFCPLTDHRQVVRSVVGIGGAEAARFDDFLEPAQTLAADSDPGPFTGR